ncbi:MAG: hypothetical protein K2H52_06010 [Lachnospiraceae bacterium]|nr:hypothetical protein [Lachnospiraceae bacterium]
MEDIKAKTLIAYFSHAGQNYTHGGIGYLEVGNTEVVAKKLHKQLKWKWKGLRNSRIESLNGLHTLEYAEQIGLDRASGGWQACKGGSCQRSWPGWSIF